MVCCIYVLNLPQYEPDLLKAHDSVTNRLNDWLCCALNGANVQGSAPARSTIENIKSTGRYLCQLIIIVTSAKYLHLMSCSLIGGRTETMLQYEISERDSISKGKQMLPARSFLLDLKTCFPPVSRHCSFKSRAEMELRTRLIYLTSPGL